MSLLTNLVAYWKLDSAAPLADAHGSNTLTDHNSVTSTTGILNEAISLNGSNQYYSITDNAALSIGSGTSFEISLWVKLNSTSGTQVFMGKGNSSGSAGNEYQVYLASGTFQFSMGNGSSGSIVNSSVSASTGTWYHLLCYFDNGAGQIGIIVNNGTPATNSVGISAYDSIYEMTLGRWPEFNGGYTNGALDEIGLWKGRVLTSGEHTQLYGGGTPPSYDTFGGSEHHVVLAATLGGITSALSLTAEAHTALAATLGGITSAISLTPVGNIHAGLAATLGGITSALHVTPTAHTALAATLGGISASILLATGERHVALSASLGGILSALVLHQEGVTVNPAWLAAAQHAQTLAHQSGSYYVVIRIEFLHFNRTFATVDVGVGDDMLTAEDGGVGSFAWSMDELEDTPRISNASVRLLNPGATTPTDENAEVHTFDAGTLLNTPVRLTLGFEGIAIDDYLPIFTGVVDRYSVTNEYIDLALNDATVKDDINLTIPVGLPYFPAAPDASRSQNLPIYFGVQVDIPTIQVAGTDPVTGTLAFDVSTTDTQVLLRETAALFPSTGSVTIGGETFSYGTRGTTNVSGRSYLRLGSLTRPSPALHVTGQAVTLASPVAAFAIGMGVQTLNAVTRADGTTLSTAQFSVITETVFGRDVVIVQPNIALDPGEVLHVSINAASPTIPLNHVAGSTPAPSIPVVPANLLEPNAGFELGDASGYTTANGGVVTVGTGSTGGGTLLTNGGAESGSTTGWTNPSGTLAVGTTNPTPQAGTYRFALTGPSVDTDGEANQDITVTANVLHELRLYYQNSRATNLVSNGDFSASSGGNSLTGWTITTRTNADIATSGGGIPLSALTLHKGTGLAQNGIPGTALAIASGAYPFQSDFYVEFYEDITVLSGVEYALAFDYMAVDDIANAFSGDHRTTNVGYKVGTPADDDLYIALTYTGQNTLMQDGVYNQNVTTVAPGSAYTPVTFTTSSTTVRLTFVLRADSPASMGSTNTLIPLVAWLDNVRLDAANGVDQSSARLLIGTSADPDAYLDSPLAVVTSWQGVSTRFLPTTTSVRVTLRSQYHLQARASYFDSVVIEQVTSQVALPVEGTYRAALTGGAGSFGDLFREFPTVVGTQYSYRVWYQTQQIGNLISNGEFNGLTGWTVQNNVNAVLDGFGTPSVLFIRAITGPPYVNSYSAEIVRDVATTIGQQYSLIFFYLTVQDTVNLGGIVGERHTDVGYKVGITSDDDSIIPLTFVGQAYQTTNGRGATPTYPFIPTPAIVFTATATTTRLTFRFESSRSVSGPGSATAFLPMHLQFHGVYLVQAAGTDQSTAALQLGTPSNPVAYRNSTLQASPGSWTEVTGTLTASDTMARLTMQSQYAITSLPVYWDDLSVIAQAVASTGGGAVPPTVLSSPTGENPIDVMLYVLQTFHPAPTIDTAAFQTARALRTDWKFTGAITQPGTLNTLLQRLAQQCACLLRRDEEGQYTVVALESSRPTVWEFDRDNILPESWQRSSPAVDSIYTTFNVYYNTRQGGSTSPADFAGVTFANPDDTSVPDGDVLVSLCVAAHDQLGKTHRLDVFAEFIFDFDTANLLLSYDVTRYTVQHDLIAWESWIDALAVTPGQVVRMDYGLLPYHGAPILAEIIGKSYNPPQTTVGFTARQLSLSPEVGNVQVPDAPVANDDEATTPLDTPVTLDVPANDEAAAGALLALDSVDLDPSTGGRQVHHYVSGRGMFEVDQDGLVTFTPDAGVSGDTDITYTIRDNWGSVSNEATILVHVGSGLGVELAAILGGITAAISLTPDTGGGGPPAEWEEVATFPGNGHQDENSCGDFVLFGGVWYGLGSSYNGGVAYLLRPLIPDVAELKDAAGLVFSANNIIYAYRRGCVFDSKLYVAIEIATNGAPDSEITTVYSYTSITATGVDRWSYAEGEHVTRMLVFDSLLWVSSTTDIQSFDGATSPTSEDSNATSCMVVFGSDLWAGQGATVVKTTGSGDGFTLQHTFTGTVTAIATYASGLAVGVVNGAVMEVWLFDGATWTQTTIGTLSGHSIFCLIEFDSKLFAGLGDMSTTSAPIYEYDGSSWQLSVEFNGLAPRDLDLRDYVESLAINPNNGVLYAGVGCTNLSSNDVASVWRTPPA